MSSLVSRSYCLAHPVEISQLYGLRVLLGTMINTKRTVFERVASSFSENRLAMPGPLGQSYRLSELCELRAARIYQAMTARFADVPLAHQLFKDLEEEENEHARLMRICLYSVRMSPHRQYMPSVRDPEIRVVMREMRRVERRVPFMSLDEALRAAEELETGEVNLIFGKLLNQVEEPEVGLLREMLRHAEGHNVSVPRRIGLLRAQLEKMGSPVVSTRVS